MGRITFVILLGAAAALAAGMLFALAAVKQQQMATMRPAGEQMSPRLIWQLARQRTWLLGIGLAAASYVVQGVALSLAPLSVVQPLLTAEVVFAIPLSVRRYRITLRRREWIAIVAVMVGLATALVAEAPRPGHPLVPVTAWAPVLGAAAVVVAAAVTCGWRARGRTRAAVYAVAAAVVMGVEASLMSATAARFSDGAVSGFTAWETYAMAACSLTVLLLIQSAFAAGPLAISMPIADALSPATAIVIGVTLFGEQLDTGTTHAVVAAAAAVVVIAAIIALDTSPVVQAMHCAESNIEENTGRRRHPEQAISRRTQRQQVAAAP